MASPADRLRERQDGKYEPPVLAEPAGGPVPPWRPVEPEQKKP